MGVGVPVGGIGVLVCVGVSVGMGVLVGVVVVVGVSVGMDVTVGVLVADGSSQLSGIV